MAVHSFFYLHLLAMVALATTASSLSPTFYNNVCPDALPTIRRVIEAEVRKEQRMGASLLRLHFHDCFVNGCDASILLDDSPTIDSEKNAFPNVNSVRGFEVIDRVKSEVDRVCGAPVVSCADILAIAARDSVVELGGPSWRVQLGRRDSTTANKTAANNDLPPPNMDLPALINNFKKHGLDERDLVALSGGHTIGFARCITFRNHIYNGTDIDPKFARQRRARCPRSRARGDNKLQPLDSTPQRFDIGYFNNLVQKRGLLHSDQALFKGGNTDELVKTYSINAEAFMADFANSMVKMGNIKPLTGESGQVRVNCRKAN